MSHNCYMHLLEKNVNIDGFGNIYTSIYSVITAYKMSSTYALTL